MTRWTRFYRWLNGWCATHQRVHELTGPRSMGAEQAACPECAAGVPGSTTKAVSDAKDE